MPTTETHSHDSTHLSVSHTRDSVQTYIHDSTAVHYTRGNASADCPPDTLYIERWRTEKRRESHAENHGDTVYVTERDSIPYIVEVPVEVPAPIPRYYKVTSLLFWLLFIINAAVIVRKIA